MQDENDELRKLMGWLSGHKPQLRIMIESFKGQDGEGLGANKVGEGSGENIPEPPKTHHKYDFPPKPNHLRNRLDTVNTKNWYKKGIDLWAEFGNEIPFGRENLLRGFGKDACGRQYTIIRQKNCLRL
jgi:hypothetical protein